jgi:HAE1 family hydrophobic/amphiphilic exporter-1
MRITLLAILLLTFSSASQAQTPVPVPEVRRLTVDEAVRAALENNLGVQVARIDPAIQDLAVAQANAAWFPTLTTIVQAASTDTPNNSFLSGAQGQETSNKSVDSNVGFNKQMLWGGSYSIGWDSTRSTTTNIFSNFSPQLRSSLSFNYQQPLLRGFRIDTPRQELLVSRKNREIADVTLHQAVIQTSRAVRNAYWDLAYAIASLTVAQQSLDLAQESLRNTRARIEIGTSPPVDEIEGQAEVATREEAVIVGQAQIETAQDALRTLIYDPKDPMFWTLRIEPAEPPTFQARTIDIESAVRTALEMRTDVQQAEKQLETADINLRLYRDETLPDVTANFNYGLTGLGGTQFLRGTGFPGPIIGQTQRGFTTVLGDLFRNDFPSWTATLNVSYPIGSTPQEVNLARSRLAYSQMQTQLRDTELSVTAEVREAGRQALTNQRRVDTTGVARQLAERRLDAEERKLAAGTSTMFLVFQAQRDLAVARNNELKAVLDYQHSLIDFEAVQEVPLR